jgi:hypothetical protein
MSSFTVVLTLGQVLLYLTVNITRNSTSMKAGSCSVDHKLQDAKEVDWITIPTKHNCIEERKRRQKMHL